MKTWHLISHFPINTWQQHCSNDSGVRKKWGVGGKRPDWSNWTVEAWRCGPRHGADVTRLHQATAAGFLWWNLGSYAPKTMWETYYGKYVSCQTRTVICFYCHLHHTAHSIFLARSCSSHRKQQMGLPAQWKQSWLEIHAHPGKDLRRWRKIQ